MQPFVITGKAKDVFRFIELKAKQEQEKQQKPQPLKGMREQRNPEQELENMMKNQERKYVPDGRD